MGQSNNGKPAARGQEPKREPAKYSGSAQGTQPEDDAQHNSGNYAQSREYLEEDGRAEANKVRPEVTGDDNTHEKAVAPYNSEYNNENDRGSDRPSNINQNQGSNNSNQQDERQAGWRNRQEDNEDGRVGVRSGSRVQNDDRT